MRYDAFMYVTGRIHMCDMTHLYVRHDAFIMPQCGFCALCVRVCASVRLCV